MTHGLRPPSFHRTGPRRTERASAKPKRSLSAGLVRGPTLAIQSHSVVDLTDAGGDYDVPALRIRGAHMLPRLRDTIIRAHRLGVPIVRRRHRIRSEQLDANRTGSDAPDRDGIHAARSASVGDDPNET